MKISKAKGLGRFFKLILFFIMGNIGLAYAYCPYGAFIAGYAHAFDVYPQQVCNAWGCSVVSQQGPCQHPIWRCR